MRAVSQVVALAAFVASVNGFPGFPGGYYHHPHRPVPPIESGRPLPSGFPTYHMPIPTGVFPTGTGGIGTGFGLGPTGVSSPLYPTTTYGGSTGTETLVPPVSTSGNSPIGVTSASAGQETCPPAQEITVTETATVTVTAGGGGAPFPTGTIGTGSLPVGTGSVYYSPHPYHTYY